MKIFSIILLWFVAFVSNGQIITTIAGNGIQGYSNDSISAINTELNGPRSVTFDKIGNLYIADIFNNRIREVDTNGIIYTIAGNGNSGYSGDGRLAKFATLSLPSYITIDIIGNLFFVDSKNHVVRKIDTGGIITTVAGNGFGAGTPVGGYGGDGGLATNAELNNPSSVAVDQSGNIFISDQGNNRIRRVDILGIITTIAGNGNSGFSGDGGRAISSILNGPIGISADKFGNIYFADESNARIRKIDNAGIITTVAGNGSYNSAGDGSLAIDAGMNPLNAVNINGSLFIDDYGNNTIRRVDSMGIITTIAGTGIRGYGGDGGPATSAVFHLPTSIAFDRGGNLYIADQDNGRIRKVTNVTLSDTNRHVGIQTSATASIKIYPNPVADILHIELAARAQYRLLSIVGSVVQQGVLKAGNNTVNVAAIESGVYVLEVSDGGEKMVRKIVKQ